MATVQKAFLVDDDEINNFICVNIIQKMGFADEVTAFESGSDALSKLEELAKEHPEQLPQVLFLDINMPIMNGWDFLEEYTKIKKEHSFSMSLFMLSSSIYQADVDKSKEYDDVTDFVTKPLREDSLNEITSKYFS